jgi:hypothetical protein
MDYLLNEKKYQEIYQDLNSASERQSKVFGDGSRRQRAALQSEEKNELDTADVSGKSVVFDANWGKQESPMDREYRKTFETTVRAHTHRCAGAQSLRSRSPRRQALRRQRDEAQERAALRSCPFCVHAVYS